MHVPKHSVVITARNEGPRLCKTVADVLRHAEGETLELLVIDDASEDSCARFLESTEYQGKPIRYERNPERRGLIWSRARGAELARGDYVTVLDAHCGVSPGWLARLAEHLEGIDGKGIAIPLVHLLEEESWRVKVETVAASACSLINPFWDFGWAEPTIIDGKVCTCTIGGMAWMCRRDWYEHIGGLDREMVAWGGENIDLPLRTWIAGGLCIVADDVRIGHLFQEKKKPAVSNVELASNKLRAAHTALSRPSFERILRNLLLFDDYRAACERLHHAPGDLARIKERIESIRSRSDRWLIDTFRLPVFEAPPFYVGRRTRVASSVVPGRTWPQWPERPRVQVVLTVEGPSRLELGIARLLEGSAYTNFDLVLLLPEEGEPGWCGRFVGHPRIQTVCASQGARRSFCENLGAVLGDAEYVALLDDRTRVQDEFWIEKLIILFEKHSKLILACPGTRRLRDDGSDMGTQYDVMWDWNVPGFGRPREGSPLAESPYQALSCPGTLLFLRREPFLELGGFDGSLHGLEERLLEFSIRAWLSGHEVYCDPGIVVEREEGVRLEQRHGAPYPPAAYRRAYAQALMAVKCFTNQERLLACLELCPGHAMLLNFQAPRIERQRRILIKSARFDDDWLFYKFGIPDYPETWKPRELAASAHRTRSASPSPTAPMSSRRS